MQSLKASLPAQGYFGFSDAELEQRIFHKALLSRTVEEELLRLFSEGKLSGTVHTCIGQELSGAVLSEFLQAGDAVFSNHRCHGHFLSTRGNVQGLIAELMGKKSGVCAGIGGSQHLCERGFYSNGIQGGIVPLATGLAQARKLRGSRHLAAVFIGDGTLGEGVVYESMNIAAKWKLPLLIVLENNLYAQSTCQTETLAGGICERARAFGIASDQSSTWDWRNLYQKAQALITGIREGLGPAFLQIDTYRLKAHSKGDDDRPREEVARYENKDPLNLWLRSAKAGGLAQSVLTEVRQAIEEAEKDPFPEAIAIMDTPPVSWKPAACPSGKVLALLNQAFQSQMARHPEILFIGEDVRSPYGGAFKVSRGLSDLFPDRVFNTPISEAAIVGIGTGLAMEGFRPFVEIMFGDFLGLAFDQLLNHASKFESMYHGKVKVNLVVRTPMGGGRGYGPTHSQTLDRHFLGIPGLRVLALNNLMPPEALLKQLCENDIGPTLLIENKILYTRSMREKLDQGFELFASSEMFPTLNVRPASSRIDVTLIGYGGIADLMVTAAQKLFEEHDIIAQVICPTQIYPLHVKRWISLIKASHHVITVEEGQGFAGFGSEVITQLNEISPSLARSVGRVVAAPHCIPASAGLEKLMLPGIDAIMAKVLQTVYGPPSHPSQTHRE